MKLIRTFLAFDTPSIIKDEMEKLQSELKKSGADVKWERKDKFHATIKFLGDVKEETLPNVLNEIDSIVSTMEATQVIYQHLGAFPNKKNPRIIWVGCENSEGILLNLKNTLDQTLSKFGFEIETRPFHPHITLGRIKSSNRLINLLPMLENLTFEPQKAIINEILVMRSILKPEGSEYSIIKNIPLRKKITV
ncbi:MAG: RNA 2',3'-cyclic phosphodiesterase [Ignavibacteriales bacterium]|nr:RNA 2',3'-cyclic phosphodiesterase [Ignavibacteriales bacterium]